jgi:pimeloyl-ACP methyl ester carboxylesterase
MAQPPALLLLHYFGGSARSWDPLAAALGPAAGRRVAPDMRGFGDNHAGGGPYGVDRYADDAAALAAGLGGRVVLVGHSMGGKVAVALAARRPPGLAGLVLVAPSPPCPEPMSDAAREELRGSFGSREGAARVARAISARARGTGPDAAAVFDRVVADHLRADRPAWDAWLDGGSREDISARAAQVAVPVLVVAGAEDDALGPAVQRRLTLPRLPAGARMETVPGSRHLVPLDVPAALAGLIGGFLSTAAAAP